MDVRRLALISISSSLASCVFIIQPNNNMPTPAPVPLTCNPTATEAPIVHLFFAARIERSTVNLADRYSKIMQDTALGLASIGANVTTAVLVREDERPVQQPLLAAWGCSLDSPQNLLPSDVIRWYATQPAPEGARAGCTVDPLVHLGEHLSDAVTQYPLSLPGTSGLSVFGGAPDLALVVHLDSLGRETGFDEPGCADAARAFSADEDGNAPWLDYAGAVAQDHVVHWFFTTEELVSREQFVAGCKSVDGFPSSVLDTLEESKKALYGPLADTVGNRGARVAGLSLCRAVVETEERAFLMSQISGIADLLGLTYDEKRVKEVLNGGIGELLNQGGENGGLTIPGSRPGT